jgi:WD40 repeat protein
MENTDFATSLNNPSQVEHKPAWVIRLQRSQCKDHITVYSCSDWQPCSHATLPTSDAADLAWSPDGTCFAVWESSLEYRVLVYAVDGSCLADYSAYSNALGIKTVAWSPTGQMLAVGSYDQVLVPPCCIANAFVNTQPDGGHAKTCQMAGTSRQSRKGHFSVL